MSLDGGASVVDSEHQAVRSGPTTSAFFGLGKTRTLKLRRDALEGTKQCQLMPKRHLLQDEGLAGWLAVHTVDFFDHSTCSTVQPE